MKIIAGKYKNRIIPTLRGAKYRPTTGKLREAIFSIITSGNFAGTTIEDANVLDLFCGSGALAFEALSRGAKSVTLIDIDKDFLQLAKSFAKEIGVENQVKCIHTNALNLPQAYKKFDLIFIDPPYHHIIDSIGVGYNEKSFDHKINTKIIRSNFSRQVTNDDVRNFKSMNYNFDIDDIYNKSRIHQQNRTINNLEKAQSDHIEKIFSILINKGWASNDSIVVVELPKDVEISYPNNIVEVLNRLYGKTRLLILKIVSILN